VHSVEELLRQLAPLRPSDVERWQRLLAYADEKSRRLLEWQVRKAADEVLGREPGHLLSCPPPAVAMGQMELGSLVYHRELWPFALREAELLQHMGVYGRSGAGKTNLTFQLLKELQARHIPFVLFDWKRNARDLIPQLHGMVDLFTPGRSLLPFNFNPFACPPGIEPRTHITILVDLLGVAFTLGDGAKSLLHRVLAEAGQEPTVRDLLARLEAMNTTGRQTGWRVSAVRCLETLAFMDTFHEESQGQAERLSQFFGHSTILELNGLNQSAKRFLIPSVLHWLFNVRLSAPDREKLRLVVILEEAHYVLGDRHSDQFFSRFLRQCRELGIGVVLVDQAPSLLSAVALGNCYTTACMNLKDPDDIRVAGSVLQLRDKDRGVLSQLPVGRAVVKLQDRWRLPFVLQVPHVKVDKGAMSDDRLRLFLAERGSRSARSPPRAAGNGDVRRVRLSDDGLQGAAYEFLLDVLQHPDSGVKERYARLGWSVDKGNRTKQQLLKVGLLEGLVVNAGNTRKLVLRPSKEGRKLLGLEAGATVESLAHEFWKRRLAQQYAAEGWTVELEGQRDPKRPELGRADLVLTRGQERWAVEVETGKSDVVQNVKNSLIAHIAKVIVVPTDSAAIAKVERELANAGLLQMPAVDFRGGSPYRYRNKTSA
jgi:hypothetical protein